MFLYLRFLFDACRHDLICNLGVKSIQALLCLKQFGLKGLVDHLKFNLNGISHVPIVVTLLLHLSVEHLECLVDLSDLFGGDVLRVNTPLGIVFCLVLQLCFYFINRGQELLFQCRDHIVKPSHLCLHHCVNVRNVFESCFLEFLHPLADSHSISFCSVQALVHITLYFFDGRALIAKLLAQNLRLLRKSNLRVFLCRFYDLVHGLEALLDLLHESALTLKTQPLVLFKLVQ